MEEKIKKLDLKEFRILQTVGTGSFGRVKLIQRKNDPTKYFALKILKKADIIKLKQVDHIKSEIVILNQIDFPLLVQMEGISQDERYLYIVMEYVAGGELFTYLRTVKNFKSEESRFYAA